MSHFRFTFPEHPPLERWQKNLYAVVIAELFVLIGFSFSNPFLPLFIQGLSGYTETDAAFWAGLATSVNGAAQFISAPFWGILADRRGRKPMVLRAQFGSAAAVALTAIAPSVLYLVSIRFIQGLLSGTIAAASALVASQTPREKMPFAMGLLMLSFYGGTTVGPLIGGVVADSLGFRAAFFITAGLIFIGGLIVLFMVEENFEKAPNVPSSSLRSVWQLATSREILPLLAALCALQAGTMVLAPVIPLLIQSMEPAGRTATVSGLAFALMGVLAAVSSITAGRLGGRVSLKSILVFSCLGTAALYLPPLWAGTLALLMVFIVLTGLLKGGFMTSASALLGMSVSGTRQGVAYGLSGSALSLGTAAGPLIGGTLAALLGFKSIFVFTAALFATVGVLSARLLPGQPPRGQNAT